MHDSTDFDTAILCSNWSTCSIVALRMKQHILSGAVSKANHILQISSASLIKFNFAVAKIGEGGQDSVATAHRQR